jgi:transposase-like protein
MKYSQDLKDLAVKKVVDGQVIVTLSKELKIPRQSINNWYQRAKIKKVQGRNRG